VIISVVTIVGTIMVFLVVVYEGHYDPVITKQNHHGENNSEKSGVKFTPATLLATFSQAITRESRR
jgi:hypothetical protein